MSNKPKLIRLELEEVRAVNYLGVDLHLPVKFKFIATNKSGSFFAYGVKPVVDDDWSVWGSSSQYPIRHLGKFDLNGFDWKNSLVEIK